MHFSSSLLPVIPNLAVILIRGYPTLSSQHLLQVLSGSPLQIGKAIDSSCAAVKSFSPWFVRGKDTSCDLDKKIGTLKNVNLLLSHDSQYPSNLQQDLAK